MKYFVTVLIMFVLTAGTARSQAVEGGEIFRSEKGFVEKRAVTDSTFTLVWGIDGHKRKLGRNFDRRVHFELSAVSNRFAALEATCGTLCWYSVILPISKAIEPIIRQYPVAYDLDNGLAAFIGGGDSLAVVVDLTGQTKTDRVLKGKCPFSFNGDCISEAYFDEGVLRVKWSTAPENEIREDTIAIRPRM